MSLQANCLLIRNGNQSIIISLVDKRAQQWRLNLHQQHQLTYHVL